MTSPTRSTDSPPLVVVANRLPFDITTAPDGTQTVRQSPGGLVTALAPMLSKQRGTWIGWPGKPDIALEATVSDGINLQPVKLTAGEVAAYYEGFSNGTLWPLYHDAVVTPEFHRTWWEVYQRVNQRFAAAAAAAAAPGATVWVHDYQLQLVPAMLRALRPDVRIGFFLHIPFPPGELFMRLPWRAEILTGMLGADVVGFQLPGGARNFTRLARRLTGAAISGNMIEHDGRTVRAAAFPISIDTAGQTALAESDKVRADAAKLRADLGSPRKIILGVDRLDYTKGINVRLRAFGELLAERDPAVQNTVMVQIATPSRERLDSYARIRERIERQVGALNGDYGRIGRPAVHYLHQSLPREDLAAFYVAADVMVVTPLRDGMNLVAKEYVACRTNDDGVLLLSEFAGAAHELRSALLVNPYDTDGVKNSLRSALDMAPADQTGRMRALRRQVLSHDVDTWAESFLATVAAHRERAATAAGRLPASVVRAVRRIASADRLLLGTDFDGTLAPIVDKPSDAQALPETLATLHALSALPDTTVAVVSGRALADLAERTGDPADMYLIGSHGAERRNPPSGVDDAAGTETAGPGGAGPGGAEVAGTGGTGGAGAGSTDPADAGPAADTPPGAPELTSDEANSLAWLREAVQRIVSHHPGVRVEHKPIGLALHVRGLPDAEADAVADAIDTELAARPSIRLLRGKKVFELAVTAADKGSALRTLRTDIRATAVLYLGDDATDENVFTTLDSRDLGVKIGSGETAARLRIDSPVAAGDLLSALLSARTAWAARRASKRPRRR